MTDKSKVSRVTALLLALFLLFYLHPYHGIRHDAVLYLGQALLRLDPGNFSGDLFFAYGSQADYTIFPQMLAWLLVHFDAASVFMAFTAAGLLFFLAASAYLLFRLFPSPHWYWGLLALLMLPSGYGAFGVFSYAESFFTGRSIAEPLVLLAIAAYLGERRALAALLWLASAVLHPLQALPVLLAWWCERVRLNRRWLHLLWLPALLLLASALDIPQMAQLTLRYDAEWLEWVQEPNKHVFLTQWEARNWAALTADVFLTSLLMIYTTGRLKTLARALLAATLLGFSCSLLLADVLHLTLPTGLQLWRVHWLLHWLAMASVPFLLYRHFRDQGGLRSVPFWLLVATVVLGSPSLVSGAAPLAVWILVPLHIFWPRLQPRIGLPIRRLMLATIPLVLVVLLIKQGFLAYTRFIRVGGLRDVVRPEFVMLAHPLVTGLLVTLALRMYSTRRHWREILTILLFPALLVGAAQWDRRSTWTRYIESAKYDPDVFGIELEQGAQVFWAGELLAPWLILHRPSYFNGNQESGFVFNRGTAQEAVKREKTINIVELQLSICRIMEGVNEPAGSCWLDESAVADACRKSAGKLDYLVLDNGLKVPAAGSWKIKGGLKGDRPITYNLYRCKDFRSETID